MATLAFLHALGGAYTGRTLRSSPLRGIQSGTILLAEEMVRRGHVASIYNGVSEAAEVEGVSYRPFSTAAGTSADLVIVNNNMGEFDAGPRLAEGGRRIVWMRNPTTIRNLMKKGNFWPLLRHRPEGVFLSKAHMRAVSAVLPFASRHLIGHGTDPRFLGTPPATEPRPPRAVYCSEAYRGLDRMLQVWRTHIHPAMPEAEFHICGDLKGRDQSDFARFGIVAHGKVPKDELADLLRTTRVLLYPGHRQETFCNVVSEAYATGNVIVTTGIGVLGERVDDGETGFIRRAPRALGAAAVKVLRDDALWLEMQKKAMAHPTVRSWSDQAAVWEATFLG